MHECPKCHFAPQRQNDIETVDGELKRLDRKTRKPIKRETGQHIFSQLLGYARNKGWKDGWAYHAYRNFTGVAANGQRKVATKPTPEILGWIEHRRIASAKARQKQQEARNHG